MTVGGYIINSRAIIHRLAATLEAIWRHQGADGFIMELRHSVLERKVRFPLLELLAVEMSRFIATGKQLFVLDRLIALEQPGSYVITGKILQLRQGSDLPRSLQKATDYISSHNEWYVCDIIAERVLGHGLLTQPKLVLPYLSSLATHSSSMAVRAIGVSVHYAVKKGLDAAYIRQVFELLLSLSAATDHHIKTGIGWGAKTVVKFYPGMAEEYAADIRSAGQWFRTKVDTGLKYSSKYAVGKR